MASGPGLMVLLEAPKFDTSVFDSRPLIPSQLWLETHGAQYTWTDIWFTNHICMAVIATVIILGFWLWVSRNMKVVPSKKQYGGEYVYNLIRNSIAREVIGENYHKYVPWLLTLFCFIVINNWFGETFVFMFPTFSKVGFAWALAILSWVLYNFVGIRKHGFLGYLKLMTIPKGAPGVVLILVAPLEFLSNFIIRPITLAVRLFANLFAGHLLVVIFVVGGTWLLQQRGNLVYNLGGVVSVIFSFAIFALELLIGFLQAYIFTILTAQYVSSAEADEH